MSERQWIKIHTGLTNDPIHRERMGVRIWFFMWLVDQADWESGLVLNYTDAQAAEDMSSETDKISARTIEGQRQKLEQDGYIMCIKGKHCQHIRIMRWRDPRKVNPPQVNIPEQPDTWYVIPRTQSTRPSRTNPPSKLRTPTLDSQLVNPLAKAKGKGKPKISKQPKPRPEDPMFNAICMVCGKDPHHLPADTSGSVVGRVERQLKEVGWTPNDVAKYGNYRRKGNRWPCNLYTLVEDMAGQEWQSTGAPVKKADVKPEPKMTAADRERALQKAKELKDGHRK